MKRPEVTAPNYEEVYDFYTDYRPSRAASHLLYGVMGVAFAPRVTFAEESKEQIDEILSGGKTVVLASNHLSLADPCNIAAMPMRERTLRPLAGNSFIPSKASLFGNTVLRRAVDGLGAVPVFREQDVPEGSPVSARRTIRKFIEMCTSRLDSGQHMAIFAEGTRNGTDPTKIQKLSGGIGAVVCRVSQVEQPPIIPIALHYDRSKRSPLVYVGQPSPKPFDRAEDVMNWLGPNLQNCLDSAIAVSEQTRQV